MTEWRPLKILRTLIRRNIKKKVYKDFIFVGESVASNNIDLIKIYYVKWSNCNNVNITALLYCQGVFQESPHCVHPRHPGVLDAGRAVADLEQVRLDGVEAGVEHQLQVGAVGHLRDELLLVHHLADVERLLTEHLAQLLSPAESLGLVRQTDHLQSDRPHLGRRKIGKYF